ncbi:MAG: EAL domain-containing protein, partial [Deferribacterota bacterium]|nr:EAL domain-containing protein [Deferribacterota bacterium]
MKTNKILDKIFYSYQPILNVYSGNTVGVEAFLRGYNNLGFSNIPQFFDTIKNEKNYLEIECEIMRKAIKGFKKANFSKNIILFININDTFVGNDEFNFDNVTEIITDEGLFLENICFDIDGGMNKHFIKTFNILIDYAKESGFKLSIDNYGVYSMNYPLLSQDSPNFIKIDRDLVSNVNNIRYGTFLQYITRIAHLFGINIIAECVETKEEYFMIKQFGIDMLQGYFVAKPTKDIESIDLVYKSVEEAAKLDRRRAATDEDLIRDRLDTVKPVLINSTMEEVFERFEDNPELTILPVVDNTG